MAGTQLRLFSHVGDERGSMPRTCKKAYIPYANGSSRWGALHAMTASWPLAVSNLVLLASDPECDDQILASFRDQLVPSWRYATWAVPYYSWHYQNMVEYGPQGGVPGLCAFVSARHGWLTEQIRAGVAAGCTQIVLLRTGYDSRPFTIRLPHTKFFVVDELEALKSQRAMLEAVLPNRNLHPRPSYVNVSWDNLATLIPALTATGFDPGSKTVFVAEGLLPHLDQESVETLLSDISALASPGSVLAFDFLHEDVLEGRVSPSGYPNLAMAVANKGQPFLSGMRPVYPAMVRMFHSYNMRVNTVMTPSDLSAWHLAGSKSPTTVGDQGQNRCALVSGLAGGMPRYLSLAAVTKTGTRLGLRDAPQPISTESLHALQHNTDGRPDTHDGTPNCFVASLVTLLCGTRQCGHKAETIAPGGQPHVPTSKSGTEQCMRALVKSKVQGPVAPVRESSGASTSSNGAPTIRAEPLVEEQSSEWMLRADTEQTVFASCELPVVEDTHSADESESGTETITITLPPTIGLDRAQSILPQSSGSSLTSHAALAAVEAAMSDEGSHSTTSTAGDMESGPQVERKEPGETLQYLEEQHKSVQDLKKLFNSLSY